MDYINKYLNSITGEFFGFKVLGKINLEGVVEVCWSIGTGGDLKMWAEGGECWGCWGYWGCWGGD